MLFGVGEIAGGVWAGAFVGVEDDEGAAFVFEPVPEGAEVFFVVGFVFAGGALGAAPVDVVIAGDGEPGHAEVLHDAAVFAEVLHPFVRGIVAGEEVADGHDEVGVEEVGIADGLAEDLEAGFGAAGAVAVDEEVEGEVACGEGEEGGVRAAGVDLLGGSGEEGEGAEEGGEEEAGGHGREEVFPLGGAGGFGGGGEGLGRGVEGLFAFEEEGDDGGDEGDGEEPEEGRGGGFFVRGRDGDAPRGVAEGADGGMGGGSGGGVRGGVAYRGEADGGEGLLEFGGGLEALGGIGLHAAADDGIDAGVEVEGGGGEGEVALGGGTGEHFEEDAAEGIEVGAVVEDDAGLPEFWGGVFWGSHGGGGGGGAGGGVAELGEAEVGEFESTVLGDEEVSGFDIAVDDAVLVSEVEGVADLGEEFEGEGGGEFAAGDELVDGGTVDEFHDEVAVAGGDVEVVDDGDVGMGEAGHGLGLGAEALDGFAVAGGGRGEDFEGDGAIEGFLEAGVDGAHAAGGNEALDLVGGEHGGEFFWAGGQKGAGGWGGGGSGRGGHGGGGERGGSAGSRGSLAVAGPSARGMAGGGGLRG